MRKNKVTVANKLYLFIKNSLRKNLLNLHYSRLLTSLNSLNIIFIS